MARQLQRRIVLVGHAFTAAEALHSRGPGIQAEIVLAHQDGHYLPLWEEELNSLPERWAKAGTAAPKAKPPPKGGAVPRNQAPPQPGQAAQQEQEQINRRLAYDREPYAYDAVSYTHLRAHETSAHL
eukprot:11585999-Alexandrium_andersonii.AAC.1